MLKTNVFYSPIKIWRDPIHWFKWKIRGFKYAYQRITKGYCDKDVWDVGLYCGRIMERMLLQLSDKHHGYPIGHAGGDDGWTEDLSHCADLFHIVNEDAFDHENSSDYVEKQIKAKNEALDFLKEHWFDLWD